MGPTFGLNRSRPGPKLRPEYIRVWVWVQPDLTHCNPYIRANACVGTEAGLNASEHHREGILPQEHNLCCIKHDFFCAYANIELFHYYSNNILVKEYVFLD
ncbi:hypothetical protein AMTRI_Chr11g153940 [Amborella trichopoda]